MRVRAPRVQHGEPMLQSIDAMLHPESIAIVGATERAGYGARFLNNLIKTGSKARLYPVNPKRETVFGLRCYPSARDIPEPVDLAAIILAAGQVVPALREFVESGARSALVVSAGFAEMGTAEGRALQHELAAVARASGVRVCGPNCLGFANVATGDWITSSPRIEFDAPARLGNIALVSQSGATCYSTLLAMANDRGIGFRYLVATGNEADLESTDFMRYLLRDPGVKAIAAVIEGFKDGASFMRTADLAAQAGKPIVVLKIGRSEAGARGATSHTAAMTGSDVVHDALFRQKAVVRVDDYDELLETTAMFAKARAPRGGRVLAVSESGGMACFTADKCGEVGLEVPPLSESTRQRLVAIMGERGSAANPADLTIFGTGPEFPSVLDVLLGEENQDVLIMSTIGGEPQAQGMVDAVRTAEKPILLAWTGSNMRRAGLELLRGSDVPLFQLPGKAALAARRLVDYHRMQRMLIAEGEARAPAQPDHGAQRNVAALLDRAHGGALNEHDSKLALAQYGVAVNVDELCRDREEALRAADALGYPVALKILSRDVTHKTEAGGVALGIMDRAALAAAYDDMQATVAAYAPHARLDGVLVQPMVTGGHELIVGVSRDVQFGPVLMLGMGGIFAEAFGAAAWRVCPVNRREAREMIDEVKGLAQIIGGYRGRPAADMDALVDALVNVARLATDNAARIASLDINPLVVLPKGRGAIALDALVVAVVAGASAAVRSGERHAAVSGTPVAISS